jgi:hypothetical protein
MVVIGSRAAACWIEDFRTPNDLDLIGTLQEIHEWATKHKDKIDYMLPTSPWKFKCKLKSNFQIEFEVADVNPSAMMLIEQEETFLKRMLMINNIWLEAWVAPVEVLYHTKRSHIYWAVHWQKNIADMHLLKEYCGHAELRKWDAYYEARLKENEAKFGPRFQANLNQPNEKFFAKSERSLNRQFEHDELHEIVKYYDRPLYEEFKEDKSKALMNFAMFYNAEHIKKLRCVREEAMVIALERYIITGKETDSVKAYQRALQRICTNLTSGWFREFAIDHWAEISTPDWHYVTLFEMAKEKLNANSLLDGSSKN